MKEACPDIIDIGDDTATHTLHYGEQVASYDSQHEAFVYAMGRMCDIAIRKVGVILDPSGRPTITVIPTRPGCCVVVWNDGSVAHWSQLTRVNETPVGIVKGKLTKADR